MFDPGEKSHINYVQILIKDGKCFNLSIFIFYIYREVSKSGSKELTQVKLSDAPILIDLFSIYYDLMMQTYK